MWLILAAFLLTIYLLIYFQKTTVQSATTGVLELLVDEEVVAVPLGSPAELRCRLSGSEGSDASIGQPLQLEWNKLDGRPLLTDGERVSQSADGGGIYIRETIEEDAGLYECRALQGDRLLFSRTTKLSIVGKWSFTTFEGNSYNGDDGF